MAKLTRDQNFLPPIGQVPLGNDTIRFNFMAESQIQHTKAIFYMTLFQLGFGVVCAGYDGDIALPSAQNLPWVILIACAGLTAHFSAKNWG